MILIIGAEAAGKRAYAASLGYTAEDMSEELDAHRVLVNLQKLVFADVEGAPGLLEKLLDKEVIICNEVGSGVIPVDTAQRLGREAVGRLCIRLAQRAERVVRVVCGVPCAIKGANPMEVLILRHGPTGANAAGRYSGHTDVPLSPEGIEQVRAAGQDEGVRAVFVSPLQRTAQTAALLFPNARQTVIPALKEMHFGVFEGRTAAEMEHDAAYRAWVDSGCMAACPGGEDAKSFALRVSGGLAEALKIAASRGDTRATFVIHGGAMMGILAVCGRPTKHFYEWNPSNGCGYLAEWGGTDKNGFPILLRVRPVKGPQARPIL